ncbi:unnamed protein product, partial [Cunninghamella blakesleeana]
MESNTMTWEELFSDWNQEDNDSLTTTSLSDLTMITPYDAKNVTEVLNPNIMYWLNNEFDMSDFLKGQINYNIQGFLDAYIQELQGKWKKEKLLDTIIIPDILNYIHEHCKKPQDNRERYTYYVQRKDIVDELLQEITYDDLNESLRKKIFAMDSYTKKDVGTSST